MTIDLEKITRAYVRMRDARDQLRKEYQDDDNALQEKMGKLEAAMLAFLNESKTDSFKTKNGTVYKQMDVIPTGSDWNAFYHWVARNDAFDALERRIKKTFVKEYMDTHDGTPPPGVSVLREYKVRVRRS